MTAEGFMSCSQRSLQEHSADDDDEAYVVHAVGHAVEGGNEDGAPRWPHDWALEAEPGLTFRAFRFMSPQEAGRRRGPSPVKGKD